MGKLTKEQQLLIEAWAAIAQAQRTFATLVTFVAKRDNIDVGKFAFDATSGKFVPLDKPASLQ